MDRIDDLDEGKYGQTEENADGFDYRMFATICTKSHHYRDSDRYMRCRQTHTILTAETVERLYEDAARWRASDEVPADKYNERTEVSFSKIFEISQVMAFEEEKLAATEFWKAYAARMAAEKAAVERRAAAEAARQQAQDTDARRRMFEQLKEEFG